MRATLRRLLRTNRSEDGVDAIATMLVLPFMVAFIFGIVSIGHTFSVRAQVEDVVRNAARGAAADGGNNNPRTNAGTAWSTIATNQLWAGSACKFSKCSQKPVVTCTTIVSAATGTAYTAQVARQPGDLITCKATYYHQGLARGYLNSVMGLGFGSLIKSFTVQATASAETGAQG